MADTMARGEKAAGKTGGKPRDKAPRGKAPARRFRPVAWVMRQLWRLTIGVVVLLIAAVVLYRAIDPPTTWYIWTEERRLGGVERQWVGADAIAPVMLRSVVAAEDANFCTHWGFDMRAIRAALEDGGQRGASTISQQVVKNVYLWHGRSWGRKAMEAVITPVVEGVWTKRRILEVYLNVAEFDEGVFGVEAAARHYFGVGPEALSARQAALLASVLPNPKGRDAARPTAFLDRRARAIRDGAATIAADGRAACFE